MRCRAGYRLCSGASFSSRPQSSSGQPATRRIPRPPFRKAQRLSLPRRFRRLLLLRRSPRKPRRRLRPPPPQQLPSPLPISPTAAAKSDQQTTHAELVQRWADAALDSQLKRMKTSLRLSADREKLWDQFESAVKDGGKARVVALQKEQGDNLSPMDRLTAKADRLAQSAANLEKIVEAAKPLYATLDDAQKHKFITLGRTSGARARALREGDEARW